MRRRELLVAAVGSTLGGCVELGDRATAPPDADRVDRDPEYRVEDTRTRRSPTPSTGRVFRGTVTDTETVPLALGSGVRVAVAASGLDDGEALFAGLRRRLPADRGHVYTDGTVSLTPRRPGRHALVLQSRRVRGADGPPPAVSVRASVERGRPPADGPLYDGPVGHLREFVADGETLSVDVDGVDDGESLLVSVLRADQHHARRHVYRDADFEVAIPGRVIVQLRPGRTDGPGRATVSVRATVEG